MAKKSGLVAIMNAANDAVIEVRDLGPKPIPVKSSMVKSFEEIRPDLADGEGYSGYTDEILAAKVRRTWIVKEPTP